VANLNAKPIVNYKGGIFEEKGHSKRVNHTVSIVGWGTDAITGKLYWIIRNSWGQYWGEMGYMRLEAGSNLLGIESEIAWATPGRFSVHNFPCSQDGCNCVKDQPAVTTQFYQDPANNIEAILNRLAEDQKAAVQKKKLLHA
jgi:cathepsin X